MKHFPEVNSFIKENPEFIKNMQPGNIKYLNLKMKNYLEGINSLLRPNGEIITIDYGDNHELVFDAFVRTFSKLGLKEYTDIFLTPGHRDITYDVNFSVFASIGTKLGYTPCFMDRKTSCYPNLHHSVTLFIKEILILLERNVILTFIYKKVCFSNYRKGKENVLKVKLR